MPIQHITEIFAFEGRIFITEAYRNLLNREPDNHGMAYYLGRLAQGYGKASVIAQLAQSTESRPWGEIKGLKKLIADERRGQHWFWGWFGHRNRIERILQSSLEAVARTELRILSLHDVILLQGKQIGNTAKQSASDRQIQSFEDWQRSTIENNRENSDHQDNFNNIISINDLMKDFNFKYIDNVDNFLLEFSKRILISNEAKLIRGVDQK